MTLRLGIAVRGIVQGGRVSALRLRCRVRARPRRVRNDPADVCIEIQGPDPGIREYALLATRVVQRLEARGFAVSMPTRYPPNDGGLALGQIWIAAHHLNEGADRVSRHPR